MPVFVATTKSGRPSWSKSATATVFGPLPEAALIAAANVPSGAPGVPLPSSTLTVLVDVLQTAKSVTPSMSKSPVAM